MIKASARPYSIFEDVRSSKIIARFEKIELPQSETSAAIIVDASTLRNRTAGEIHFGLKIDTSSDEVRAHVLPFDSHGKICGGVRLLCKESKFRKFYPADRTGLVEFLIPLNRLRGVLTLETLFLTTGEVTTIDKVSLPKGAIVGVALKPIVVTLDEDWAGVTIPVDWLNFQESDLPVSAFMHVEFSGGSQVPKIWLNSRFRSQIESILLRTGDNSPVALAGAALREFFWLHAWERILLWAIRNENPEEPVWPATRIAIMWRNRFAENEWALPSNDSIDAGDLDDLSLKIQHCVQMGFNLSRMHGLLRFQPEANATA